MATFAREPSGRLRIRFWYGGRQFKRALATTDEEQAKAVCRQVEEMIDLLERGWLTIPPGADPGTYIVTSRRMTGRPVVQKIATLGDLFDRYRKTLPDWAKEASTKATELIHIRHLQRHIGATTVVQTLTTQDLQGYVDRRSQDKWRRGRIGATTIKKETATFRAIWNWAVDLNYLTGLAPLKGVRYPKEREKPPFQTWDEIERSIRTGALSKDAEKQLWQALFLTSEQVASVLAHVAAKPKKPDFVYPMLAFVAYTGARRSEMLRARVEDFNLDAGTAVVREKKRDRTKEETFRHVDLAEPLVKTLREWFEHLHPGGPFAFSRFAGRPLSRQNAGKAFRGVLSKSKWQWVRGFHVFRHSFASNAAARGVDQRVIDAWLGHQTEAMRRRYRHLFPDQRRKAIELVFPGGR